MVRLVGKRFVEASVQRFTKISGVRTGRSQPPVGPARLGLRGAWLAGLVLAVALVGAAGGEDPPAAPAATADTPPAATDAPAEVDDLDKNTLAEPFDSSQPEVRAFQDVIAEIVKYSAEMREFGGQKTENDKRDEFARQAQAMIDRMDQLVDQATAAAETAVAKFPAFQEGERFLLGSAFRLVEQDRLEEAERVGTLLEPRHGQSIRLLNFLGRCTYELADLDRAELYFRRANDRAAIEPMNRELLLKIDSVRQELAAESARREAEQAKDDLPRVHLKTTRGDIVIELFEDDQPNLTANFLGLISQKFYDGLPFFRVTPAFGATAGCPQGDGSGGPGYELNLDSSGHRRLHQRGAVSMIVQGDVVHGSQFFIDYRLSSLSPADQRMPVFGRVIEGLEVAVRLHRVDPHEPITKAVTDRIIEGKILRARAHRYVVTTTLSELQDQVKAALNLATEKKLDEAIVKLEALDKRYPKVFDVQLSLGLVYEEAKRGPEALPHLQTALEQRPFHPDLSFRVGVLLANAGNFAEAAERFEAAVKLKPNDARCYNNLASMLARLDRNEEAIAALESAVRIDPNYGPAKTNLEKLKAIVKNQPAPKEETAETSEPPDATP